MESAVPGFRPPARGGKTERQGGSSTQRQPRAIKPIAYSGFDTFAKDCTTRNRWLKVQNQEAPHWATSTRCSHPPGWLQPATRNRVSHHSRRTGEINLSPMRQGAFGLAVLAAPSVTSSCPAGPGAPERSAARRAPRSSSDSNRADPIVEEMGCECLRPPRSSRAKGASAVWSAAAESAPPPRCPPVLAGRPCEPGAPGFGPVAEIGVFRTRPPELMDIASAFIYDDETISLSSIPRQCIGLE